MMKLDSMMMSLDVSVMCIWFSLRVCLAPTFSSLLRPGAIGPRYYLVFFAVVNILGLTTCDDMRYLGFTCTPRSTSRSDSTRARVGIE